MKIISVLTFFALLLAGCFTGNEDEKANSSEVLLISGEPTSSGKFLLEIRAARSLFDEDAERITTFGLDPDERSRDFDDDYFTINVLVDTGLVEISLVNYDDKDDWANGDKLDGSAYWHWQDKADYKGIIAFVASEDGIETISWGEYLDLKDGQGDLDTTDTTSDTTDTVDPGKDTVETTRVDTVLRVDTVYNDTGGITGFDTVYVIIPPSVLKMEDSRKVDNGYEYTFSLLWNDSIEGDKPFAKVFLQQGDATVYSLGDLDDNNRRSFTVVLPDGYHTIGYGGDINKPWAVIRQEDLFVHNPEKEYPILGFWAKDGKIYPRELGQILTDNNGRDTIVIHDTIPGDTVTVPGDTTGSDTLVLVPARVVSVDTVGVHLDTAVTYSPDSLTKRTVISEEVTLRTVTRSGIADGADTSWSDPDTNFTTQPNILSDVIVKIVTGDTSVVVDDDTLITIPPTVEIVSDTSLDTTSVYQDQYYLTARIVIREVQRTDTLTTSGLTDGGSDTSWTTDTSSFVHFDTLSDNTVQNAFKLVSLDSVSVDTFLIEVGLNDEVFAKVAASTETEAFMYVSSDVYSGPWVYGDTSSGVGPVALEDNFFIFPVTVVVGDINRVNFQGGSGDWAQQHKLILSGFFKERGEDRNIEFIFDGTDIQPVP